MENKYLKPMLDTGSPRVFNCNELTHSIVAENPEAPLFFRTKMLNAIVLIKDAVPEYDRRPGSPSVGTKLYFPFNEDEIYEGGRTIFLQEKGVESAIKGFCGENASSQDDLTSDLLMMKILDRMPSLDPFLMKDAFLREKIEVNPSYFEVSAEAWAEIESFMLQKFEPLILAAFPDAKSSEDKARQLIDKIWEAKDIEALLPLIDAFRLPRDRALEIFSSWKGIVYYSYQYTCEQGRFVDLIKWLIENEAAPVGVTAAEAKEVQTLINQARDQLRLEWQKTDEIVRAYQQSYDKMFKEKVGSADFLAFLKNSEKTYWEIGSSLGKVTHATYCWEVMTSRFKDHKVSWPARQEIARLLGKVLEPEKKSTTSMAW
ncbi:MAG: hypothetical protein AB7E52_01720 [Bdellovibrionales bacterium]